MRGRGLPVAAVLCGALAACSTGSSAPTSAPRPATTSGSSSGSTSAAASTTASATSTETPPSASASASASPSTTTAKSTPKPVSSCVTATVSRLSPEQQAGQLLGVALLAQEGSHSLDSTVARSHAGTIIYLGGWTGQAKVRAASHHLQSLATAAATGSVRMLVGADQEGGEVRQLRGPGFTALPTALAQGAQPSATRVGYGRTLGTELKAAGVNLDLAPVADTVPPSLGLSNGPIGMWGREYGHDPGTVGDAAVDVVRGLRSAGVEATVKHFPGLGRIRNNTDFYSTGITDTVTTADDPYLQPFARGIRAGAGLVMTSTATYTKIDATNPASLSPKVIDGLLRARLHFDGVVISDDLHAASVRALPAADRAIRFVEAGGDIALTGSAAEIPTMAHAIVRRAATDRAFEAKVRVAAGRVISLKARMGLVPGCAG